MSGAEQTRQGRPGAVAIQQPGPRLVVGAVANPKRVGLDFTGEVAALGAGVTRFTASDRVWGVLAAPPGSAVPPST